ncbi:MAG TPA: O-antigen ligase family protein [Blastocatellia bacterium]|nr:O-antigen ligase family protein [Blastocatellia bacterium]
MSPRPTITPLHQITEGEKLSSESAAITSPTNFDRFAAIETHQPAARWFNRAIIFFLILFALSIPHSIAASQISLGLGLIGWLLRDLSLRKFHIVRTPIDWSLVCFLNLTVLSSLFSVEPSVSLPKLKSLVLFTTIYLLATNLRPSGVRLLTGLLILSSLVGVSFSLLEKLQGRGMIITSIAGDSPLAQSDLRPGDVIWMIARHRVASAEAATAVIRRHRSGEKLDIEALHAGDPVPVTLTVTDELKANPNPLGITTGGRSRQFRVSGFSRQFLTYAEQMQILAMLAFGGLLAGLLSQQRTKLKWLILCSALFGLFGSALILTASRAVIASFIMAILIVASCAGRRTLLIALIAAITLGALGVYVVTSARQQIMTSFNDDSTARRIGYMQAGLRIIPKHPLLGVGMDSHKLHWKEWGFPGEYITHTHSTPIQIAMDRGVPALFCYGWLIVALLLAAVRSFKQKSQPETQAGLFEASLPLGVFGAVAAFSLSSLTNYNFGDSETLTMMLFVVGLFFAANRK